jgi:hypothetical protein
MERVFEVVCRSIEIKGRDVPAIKMFISQTRQLEMYSVMTMYPRINVPITVMITIIAVEDVNDQSSKKNFI